MRAAHAPGIGAGILSIALLLLPLPAAAELGLNIFGFAYHFDRELARERNLDNEFIAGAGLRYTTGRGEPFQWVADVGAYHDSGRNTAYFAGAGPAWKISRGWYLAVALAAMQSDTYNRGRVFVAPLPLAAYDFRSVTLNFTFVPKASQFNDIPTFVMWLTWWP